MSSSLAVTVRRGAAAIAAAAAGLLSSGGHLTPDELADADSRFRVVDGVRVHYKLHKSGVPGAEREVFVAVHGFGANLSTFESALPALVARRAPAVGLAFDSPGFGLTSRPGLLRLDRYRWRFGARIVCALLPARPRGAPVVIGFSIGARAALAYAVEAEERPRGLVLIAPAILPRVVVGGGDIGGGIIARGVGVVAGWAVRMVKLLLVLLSVVFNPVLMLVLRVVVGSGKFWVRGLSLARGDPKTLTQRDVDAYRRPMAVRNWAGGILNFTRSMVLERQTEVLCLIGQLVKACPDLPVLIVHGSRDRIIPLSNSQVIARQIPRATLIVMPGKGHVPHEEDGEEFASIVDKWLQSTTLAPESQR